MQKAVQEFTIGFFDSSGVFSIYAKKDDTNRAVKFHIADGGNDYAELLTEGHLVISVRVKLPDGHILPDVPVDVSAVDPQDMSVTVPLTKEMLQESGVVMCELVFASTADGKLVSTTHFNIIVQNNFSGVDPATQLMFDTWTELYVAVRALEDSVEAAEAVRQENEIARQENEELRQENEELRSKNMVFTGTVAEWDGLPSDDKAKYKTVILIDD